MQLKTWHVLNVARISLTVDSLRPDASYQVYFTEYVDGQQLACGGFVDVFVELELKDRQLFTVWRDQPRLDCRCITRIEVR